MSDYLTTRQCADLLGVSTAFMREELRCGALKGEAIPRDVQPGRRWAKTLYRIYPEDFRAYCARYWPRIDTSHLSKFHVET